MSTEAISSHTALPLSSGTTEATSDSLMGGRSFASGPLAPIGAIPRSQLYFWSRTWQRYESEATADIAAGDVATFEDAQDALRWLLEDDEK